MGQQELSTNRAIRQLPNLNFYLYQPTNKQPWVSCGIRALAASTPVVVLSLTVTASAALLSASLADVSAASAKLVADPRRRFTTSFISHISMISSCDGVGAIEYAWRRVIQGEVRRYHEHTSATQFHASQYPQ